jgi:hypothetical protein
VRRMCSVTVRHDAATTTQAMSDLWEAILAGR